MARSESCPLRNGSTQRLSGESAYRWNASWTPTGYSFTIPQFGLIVSTQPLTSRVPDLAVFESDTVVERDGYIHSAPQLVVEVLSPPTPAANREEKIGDYARIGVPEVWVVSPEGRTVEILYLAEGYLRSAQVLREGVLTLSISLALQVEIARIWPE